MDLLKSFIFPHKMRRFRNMSIFISIIIFFITVYILMFPIKIRTNGRVEQYIENNKYFTYGISQVVLNSDDKNLLTKRGYNVKDKVLGTSSDEEVVEIIKTSYTEDGKKVNVTLVFDPYNVREEEIVVVGDLYYKKFNIENPTDEDKTKALYIGKLISSFSYNATDFNYDEYLDEYGAKTLEELKELDSKLNLFSLYNLENEENVEDYLIIFYPDYFIINDEDKIIGSYYREELDIEFAKLDNFGHDTAAFLTDICIKADQATRTFYTLLSSFVLPFIIVLIIWLFSRKTGYLKTYKEYYNIAAISSILPLVISFIVSWFWDNGSIIHSALSVMFFLYSIYMINMTREEA